ncbi:hypothetical protein B0H14DRAFT_2618595 [Mycena olivaceomarginata]|nr:hypothetical protein B0H14DRAFT_2618595 [Mycena olivaceomarginata]
MSSREFKVHIADQTYSCGSNVTAMALSILTKVPGFLCRNINIATVAMSLTKATGARTTSVFWSEKKGFTGSETCLDCHSKERVEDGCNRAAREDGFTVSLNTWITQLKIREKCCASGQKKVSTHRGDQMGGALNQNGYDVPPIARRSNTYSKGAAVSTQASPVNHTANTPETSASVNDTMQAMTICAKTHPETSTKERLNNDTDEGIKDRVKLGHPMSHPQSGSCSWISGQSDILQPVYNSRRAKV